MHHLAAYIAIAILGFVTSLFEPAFAEGGSDGGGSAASAPGLASAKQAIAAKDYRAALPLLQEIVATDPGNADAWNLLGYSSRKTGDMAAAATAYARALTINPGHLGALEYQGEMFVQLGQIDKAKANLATLQSLCGACEEMVDLQQAIDSARS